MTDIARNILEPTVEGAPDRARKRSNGAIPALGPDSDLDGLHDRGVLTEEEVHRLATAGIKTCRELANRAANQSDRHELAEDTSIGADRLLLAAATANLLALEGPGAFLAERTPLGLEWSSANLDDPQFCELLESVASADRAALLKWLGTDVLEQARQPARQTEKASGRRAYAALAAGLLVLIAWAVIAEWSRLFPPASDDAGTRFAQSIVRDLTWLSLGYLAIFTFAVGVMVAAVGGLRTLSDRVVSAVGKRILSHRDWLIVSEAVLRAPRRARRILGFTDRFAEIIAVAGFVAVGLIVFTRDYDLSVLLVSALNAILVISLYLIVVSVQVLGFRKMEAAWAGQVRKHFASFVVTSLLIQTALVVAGIVLLGTMVLESGLPRLEQWGVARAGHQGARLETAASVVGLDEQRLTDLRTWGEDYISDWRAGLVGASKLGHDILSGSLRALNLGYLGALFAVAVAEYVYVNHRKGLGALGIWFATTVISEWIPDWVEHAVTLSPLVLRISILGLGTTLILSVVSGLWGEGAHQRDRRECARCYLLADPGDRHCSHCGEPLRFG